MRVWRDKAGNHVALAEFGGLVIGGQTVVLWKNDGQELPIPKESLSKEDQDWIAAGRWWTRQDGTESPFQASVVKWIPGAIRLKFAASGELHWIPLGDLTLADQEWVSRQEFVKPQRK
jgi:hypothetical protein